MKDDKKKNQKRKGLLIKQSGIVQSCPVRSGMMITFTKGLPGFDKEHTYRFTESEDYKPFLFMESINDSRASFVCVSTFLVYPDYELFIPNSIVESLGITSADHVGMISLVTVGASVEETTVNLMSPLLINTQAGFGEQLILDGVDYPVRYRIWDAIQRQNQRQLAAC